jgi:hypothetical protein
VAVGAPADRSFSPQYNSYKSSSGDGGALGEDLGLNTPAFNRGKFSVKMRAGLNVLR